MGYDSKAEGKGFCLATAPQGDHEHVVKFISREA